MQLDLQICRHGMQLDLQICRHGMQLSRKYVGTGCNCHHRPPKYVGIGCS